MAIPIRSEQLFDAASLDDELLDLLGPRLSGLVAAAVSGDRPRLHQAERDWAEAAIRALDIRVDVVGLGSVDPRRRYVVAPLHEGFADVLALLRLPLDLNWVIRDELLELPYFGEYLDAAGHIAVTPELPRSAIRRIWRGAEETFSRGESLVVFPQGTVLGLEAAFQAGAFHLAERFDSALLPVVLTGSHRVWEYPFAATLRRGQHIRLEVLDPIEPGDAVAGMRAIERQMKQRALDATTAPARRYLPKRDGIWPGYRFDIDPDYAVDVAI